MEREAAKWVDSLCTTFASCLLRRRRLKWGRWGMGRGTRGARAGGNGCHWASDTKIGHNLVGLVHQGKSFVLLFLDLKKADLVLGCIKFCNMGAVVDPLSQGGLDTK